MSQHLQAEHKEWQRRQAQAAVAQQALREQLQAVEEERRCERERDEAQIGQIQAEIMTLQKELRDHAQFMDSRFNSFEDHLEDILQRKGFSLPNSQPPQDSDEDRQDKGL